MCFNGYWNGLNLFLNNNMSLSVGVLLNLAKLVLVSLVNRTECGMLLIYDISKFANLVLMKIIDIMHSTHVEVL